MIEPKITFDISVLIATYNRAATLRQTLENMVKLDMDGIDVQFVIINNNGSDNTKQIVESFFDRLKICYLYEPRSGKNCALNKALSEVSLGNVVVFTDDDVKPNKDWLRAIITTTKHNPDYSVFGGRIYAVWPQKNVPLWMMSSTIQTFGFAVHNYGNTDHIYAPTEYPFGPNFWVRRDVFTNNRRFNENIGPKPRNRIMGSETSFLMQLKKDGYRMLYCPSVIVGHIVQSYQITPSYLKKKAFWYGRFLVHYRGLPKEELHRKYPRFWNLLRYILIFRYIIEYSMVLLLPYNRDTKYIKLIGKIHKIGFNYEAIITHDTNNTI